MAKWWANIGAVKVSYTVTFFGITPSSKEIMFHGADGITRVDLKSSLHLEEAQPEAKLKYSVSTVQVLAVSVWFQSSNFVIFTFRFMFNLLKKIFFF